MAPAITCIVPIRMRRPADREMFEYLHWLGSRTELIVVDGSDPPIFAAHARAMPANASHCAPDYDLTGCANGKVAGVLTGFRRASHDAVVIADDDVRYDEGALARVTAALAQADLVRPQNYFEPLP